MSEDPGDADATPFEKSWKDEPNKFDEAIELREDEIEFLEFVSERYDELQEAFPDKEIHSNWWDGRAELTIAFTRGDLE